MTIPTSILLRADEVIEVDGGISLQIGSGTAGPWWHGSAGQWGETAWYPDGMGRGRVLDARAWLSTFISGWGVGLDQRILCPHRRVERGNIDRMRTLRRSWSN